MFLLIEANLHQPQTRIGPDVNPIMLLVFSDKLCSHPYTVEDVPVGEDADVKVRLDDVVEFCVLLIPEESVWHPYLKYSRLCWSCSYTYEILIGILIPPCSVP